MRGFFLGFLGREVQSVLGFLKGKTSNFVSNLRCLIRPCLGKIIFSFKVFVQILAVYVGIQWISIFPLFLLCYGDIFLDIFL